MSLRRRCFIALGTLSIVWAALSGAAAQDTGPILAPHDIRTKDPILTRTGARKTAVVAAVDRVKGAVVNIHSERSVMPSGSELYPVPASPNRVNGMGTGIIIDPRGYIVTNQHVIDDVTSLRIRLSDGASTNAIVIARHPELDLAIIKIDPPYALTTMPIGTANDLMVGETVIAVGNAYGYEHTVSVGVVSAVKRDVSLNKDMSYKSLIQTDASINPGNSGGPLVNVNGELVGVNVAIRAGAQGIGFAIPVDHMVRSVTEMLKTRRRNALYDGLTSRDVLVQGTDGLVRKVVVEFVDPSGPADAAGLHSGDVLVSVGDVKVESGIDVERGLLDRRPGETLTVMVRRKDQDKMIELPLGGPADRMVRPVVSNDVAWQRLGVHLTAVGGELVSRVNNQLHGGMEITAVNTNGPAAKAGLRKGDILVGLHKWETVNTDNVNYILNHPDLASVNSISFFIVRAGQMRSGNLIGLP